MLLHMMRITVLALLVLLSGCLGTYNRPLQLISGSGPIYPPEARANAVEGFVVLHYDVSADGDVMNVRVVSAEPPGTFDEAAVLAVSSWRYNAPIVDGEPQAVANVESRVEFKVSGAEQYDGYE